MKEIAFAHKLSFAMVFLRLDLNTLNKPSRSKAKQVKHASASLHSQTSQSVSDFFGPLDDAPDMYNLLTFVSLLERTVQNHRFHPSAKGTDQVIEALLTQLPKLKRTLAKR